MAVAPTREGNREKLLRGAMTCLRDKGYARTTARDLVEASGANLASIGYHFGGKEALLNEAIAAAFRDWVAEIERTTFAPEAASIPERLALSLGAMIDRFDELEPFLISFVEAFPQAIRSPELRTMLAASYEDARSAGAAMIIRALEADGTTLSREHAETISSALTAVCDGLILQWLLDPERVPSSGDLIDALSAVVPALLAIDGDDARAR